MSENEASPPVDEFSSAMRTLIAERGAPLAVHDLQAECAKGLRECAAAIHGALPERNSVNGGTAVVSEANQLATLLDEGITIFVLSAPTSPEINFGLGQLVELHALRELLDECAKLQSAIEGQPADDIVVSRRTAAFYAFIRSWRLEMLDPALSDVASVQLLPNSYRIVLQQTVQQALIERQSRRINELERDAKKALEYTRRAAREVASESIAGTFEKSAEDEQLRMRVWTSGTFLALGVGVALSIWAFSRGELFASYSGWQALFVKVLVGVPFYGVAAYCARIAGSHRNLYRHFFILVAQLNSVFAYVEDLPDEQKRDLTVLLGQRAFGSPDVQSVDTSNFAVVPADLVAAAAKIIEVAEGTVRKK